LFLLGSLDVQVEATRHANGLSGGQAQRVALCRALLLEPRIILADEPTGNLDSENAVLVSDRLFNTTRDGCTIVIATHDLDIAARCDSVIRL
jgi:ABC-type lipoprotein export system ATPase subunit